MPSFKTKCDFSFKSEKTPHKTIPQPFNLTQLKVDKILTEQETNVVSRVPFNDFARTTLKFLLSILAIKIQINILQCLYTSM